jgi:hypothetical protein
MTYEAFKTTVEEMVAEIPDEFMQGLQGVHVLEHARPEPEFRNVWRMGEYLDPGGGASFLGGNPGLGRHIALYYGSFVQIARGGGFDWEAEIWETLTHELRHHVESLAGDGSLIEEDMRRNEYFRQRQK